MTDTPTEPGLAELSVISVINGTWDLISIDQYGPDGTEKIAMLTFFSCPICRAVIPPAETDADGKVPEGQTNFVREHASWHIKSARNWDHVNTVVNAFREQMESPDG